MRRILRRLLAWLDEPAPPLSIPTRTDRLGIQQGAIELPDHPDIADVWQTARTDLDDPDSPLWAAWARTDLHPSWPAHHHRKLVQQIVDAELIPLVIVGGGTSMPPTGGDIDTWVDRIVLSLADLGPLTEHVGAVQISNEPNLQPDRWTPAWAAQCVLNATLAVHRLLPDVSVITPGFAPGPAGHHRDPRPWVAAVCDMLDVVDWLAAVDGSSDAMRSRAAAIPDRWAFHPYPRPVTGPRDPDGGPAQLRTLRAVAVDRGRAMPWTVTEVGQQSDFRLEPAVPAGVDGERRQADHLLDVLATLEAAPWVDRVFVFKAWDSRALARRDPAEAELDRQARREWSLGLRRIDWTPKPAWYELRDWARQA